MTNQSPEQDIDTAAEALAQAIARRVLELVEGGGVGRPTEPGMGFADAAAALGVPENWLRKQTALRNVPCRRYSAQNIRFDPADIDAIREQFRAEPTGSQPARRRNRRRAA